MLRGLSIRFFLIERRSTHYEVALEPRMLQSFIHRDALLHLNFEHALDQVLDFFRYELPVVTVEGDLAFLNSVNDFFGGLSVERRITAE